MKKHAHRSLYATAMASFFLIPTTHAEVQSYVFNGTLTDFYSTFFSEATNAGIDTFVLEVDVETTALLVYQDPTTKSYTNVVARFETTSSGGGGWIWTFPTPNFDEGSINAVTYNKAGDMDSLTIELDFMQSGYRYVEYVTITQQAQPFLWLGEGFPLVLSGDYQANVFYDLVAYDGENLSWQVTGEGYTTSVVGTFSDSDFDGVEDALDQCPNSNLDDTVSFGEFDSGVPNGVDADGCSLMDYYAACEAEQSEPTGFFQPTYSGTSYCEQQVGYQAYRDGLIDYTQLRTLRTTLYQYHRSGG
ncbi:hypothetical protein [Pseudidiomarina sediminum]|uniref:hypothetical protein n=1 Tax=Pseudidiomarina sediminum TaxID=431675 RepID=UPI001C980EEC|nr:hypothetical protein [Pseudidiomarina sediminum]MBY6063805.1 hypothetical protein [Pseudidiomarina sediminum]